AEAAAVVLRTEPGRRGAVALSPWGRGRGEGYPSGKKARPEQSPAHPSSQPSPPRGERVKRASRPTLPGFGPTLGFTLFYLSLLVLIPLAGVFAKAAGLGLAGLWDALSAPRVLAALKLSFGAALIAAAINAVFGSIVAWVFV